MSKQVLEQLQNQHPDSPWLWKQDWNDGVVRTNGKSSMIGGIAMTILWNAITWPMIVLVLPGELSDQNYLALLMLIFPLAGIGFAVMAFRSIRRFMKFGESEFQMAFNPGVVGGELVGVIVSSVKLDANDGFHLTLNCVRQEVTGTGKHRRMSEKILWQSNQKINRALESNSGDGTAVPVQFTIPFDCDPCSPDQSSTNRTFWKLEIVADQPGVDFHATFEVPVFKTETSNPNFQPDTSLVEEYVDPTTVDEIYQKARLIRQTNGVRLTINFPFLRNYKSALSGTMFLAIWIGITALMTGGIGAAGFLSFPGLVGLLFVGVFGLFGLLISLLVLELWMWRGSIAVDQKGIEATSGCLSSKKKSFDIKQIQDVSFKRTMQSGSLVFYDLIVETTADKSVTIGKRIANEAACRAIIDDIEQHLHRANSTEQSESSSTTAKTQSNVAKGFPRVDSVAEFDSFQTQ